MGLESRLKRIEQELARRAGQGTGEDEFPGWSKDDLIYYVLTGKVPPGKEINHKVPLRDDLNPYAGWTKEQLVEYTKQQIGQAEVDRIMAKYEGTNELRVTN